MSAKSELKDLLEELSEEDARKALAALRPGLERPPRLTDLMKMTRAERAAVFARFPPVYDDTEEDREWDAIDDFIEE